MSKMIELSDERYQTLERAAAARGQTPETLLAQVIDEMRDPHTDPRYYETDDWLRHLGVSEDMIADVNREIADEEDIARRSNADAC